MAKKPSHSLTPQEKATVFRNGTAVVVAAAGSGKTSLIKQRYRSLLMRGVTPDSILLLSHSRKAAQALASMPPGQAAIRNAFTVHGLCHRLLREFHVQAGLKADFRVADESFANTLLLSAMKSASQGKAPSNIKQGRLRSYITLRRSGLLSREEALQLSRLEKPPGDFLKIAARKYKVEKKKAVVLDFDDLLHYAYRLLNKNTEVRKTLRLRYRHIMVDECQDISPAQLRIINRIFGNWREGQKRSLVFVGDPGQSIYSFHGADYNYLRELAATPGVKKFPLEVNHRSSQRIIALANALDDAHFEGRLPTKAAPDAELGVKPSLTVAGGEKAEAEAICALIRKNKKAGFGYGSQAILLRTSTDFGAIQEALRTAAIPFVLVGGAIGRRAPTLASAVIDIFQASTRPDDADALRKALRLVSTKMGRSASSRKALLKRREQLEGEELAAVPRQLRCIKRAADEEQPITTRVSRVRKAMQPLFPSDDAHRGSDAEKAAVAHLKGLAEESSDASEFLSSYALDPTPIAPSDAGEAVTLSTIHGAKGLEWDVIYLPQLQENHLPHRKSSLIDEERRLLYVGVTRARKRLYFSYPAGPQLFGTTTPGKPSRFISDPKVAKHLDTKG